MSANNWAQCPRCTRRGEADLNEREAKVWGSYGKIPMGEFDAARNAAQTDRAEFANRDRTFREDYEIYGAETGEVTVAYSGSCQECGLSLTFQHDHVIPEWEKP